MDGGSNCPNCKRTITTNLDLHVIHCSRNFKLCTRCDEAVPISEMDEHMKSHATVECPMCKKEVEEKDMEKHEETACTPRMSVECEFCHLSVPLLEYETHLDYCGSRTEQCHVCGSRVTLNDLEMHLRGHTFSRDRGSESSGRATPDIPTPAPRSRPLSEFARSAMAAGSMLGVGEDIEAFLQRNIPSPVPRPRTPLEGEHDLSEVMLVAILDELVENTEGVVRMLEALLDEVDRVRQNSKRVADQANDVSGALTKYSALIPRFVAVIFGEKAGQKTRIFTALIGILAGVVEVGSSGYADLKTDEFVVKLKEILDEEKKKLEELRSFWGVCLDGMPVEDSSTVPDAGGFCGVALNFLKRILPILKDGARKTHFGKNLPPIFDYFQAFMASLTNSQSPKRKQPVIEDLLELLRKMLSSAREYRAQLVSLQVAVAESHEPFGAMGAPPVLAENQPRNGETAQRPASSASDLEDTIPCENCLRNIPFADFSDHLFTCPGGGDIAEVSIGPAWVMTPPPKPVATARSPSPVAGGSRIMEPQPGPSGLQNNPKPLRSDPRFRDYVRPPRTVGYDSSSDDDTPTIPCDICHRPVEEHAYPRHLNECRERRVRRIREGRYSNEPDEPNGDHGRRSSGNDSTSPIPCDVCGEPFPVEAYMDHTLHAHSNFRMWGRNESSPSDVGTFDIDIVDDNPSPRSVLSVNSRASESPTRRAGLKRNSRSRETSGSDQAKQEVIVLDSDEEKPKRQREEELPEVVAVVTRPRAAPPSRATPVAATTTTTNGVPASGRIPPQERSGEKAFYEIPEWIIHKANGEAKRHLLRLSGRLRGEFEKSDSGDKDEVVYSARAFTRGSAQAMVAARILALGFRAISDEEYKDNLKKVLMEGKSHEWAARQVCARNRWSDPKYTATLENDGTVMVTGVVNLLGGSPPAQAPAADPRATAGTSRATGPIEAGPSSLARNPLVAPARSSYPPPPSSLRPVPTPAASGAPRTTGPTEAGPSFNAGHFIRVPYHRGPPVPTPPRPGRPQGNALPRAGSASAPAPVEVSSRPAAAIAPAQSRDAPQASGAAGDANNALPRGSPGTYIRIPVGSGRPGPRRRSGRSNETDVYSQAPSQGGRRSHPIPVYDMRSGSDHLENGPRMPGRGRGGHGRGGHGRGGHGRGEHRRGGNRRVAKSEKSTDFHSTHHD